MPFTGKLASALTVGAKTWRPKTADQQFVEAEQKRLTEAEQMKRHALQKKIETLENVRKLEAKTQALNEMAMAAEIRSQEHEVAMKERQLAEARRAELAKLELAKRLGRESLSEADLARIRRERMKAELLARAAGNHAVQESMRPIKAGIDLGPRRTSMPPPPPTLHPLPPPMNHSMPMPSRTPSAASHRAHQHMPMPMGPPMSHTPMPRPPVLMPVPPPPMPMSDLHRRIPSEPGIHMRRLSGSLQPASLGIGPGQWGSPNNALRGPNHVPHHGSTAPAHFDRPSSLRHQDSRLRAANLRALKEESMSQLAIRAQAERLRRRRLQQLDGHARASNLRAQALRDLRKRELMMKLRERGIQQREIDSQVRLMVEHEQMMTEAQLKEMRDREHRLMLKEKGLQEREIQDQIRRREEKDREILRIELEKLERELRRKELLDAELSIKHAFERGESPPLGIKRPTIDEIENEGLLAEDFFDDFDSLDPRIRQEIMAATNLGPDYQRGHGRSPSVGARTPLMRASSPGAHSHTSQMRDRIRDEQIRVSEENHIREGVLASLSRANTPRIRDEILSQMTPRLREEALENERRAGAGISPREEMLGDRLNTHHHPVGRPRSQSFDRRSPGIPSTPRHREEIRAALLDEAEARDREDHRRRDDLRYREDLNAMNSVASQHKRTPSMRDNLELHHDSARRHLDLPSRSASRASSRGGDHDAIPRSLSRSGSIRDGYSPSERLGLPSRPASRNLTAEDLGLTNLLGMNGRAASRERQPVSAHVPNDDLLAARLHSAAVNSELNGGARSRANSRAERLDDDLLRSARSQLTNDSSLGLGSLSGLRSRANSRAEAPSDEVLRGMSRNSLGADLPNTGGRRSRANSTVGQNHQTAPSRSPRPSEFGEFGLQDEGLRARESRAPSRNAGNTLSPGYSLMGESGGWNSLSNEELSQLSTEQLEMLLLSETGDYPNVSYDSMSPMTKEEISQLTSEQLDVFMAGQDGRGGMSGLSLSSSGAHRNISRRPSRNDLGDSPPFGSVEQHGHGSSSAAHDLQRSRSRNDNESYGERYGANTPQTRTSPHNQDSLYSMPGQYDPYGSAHDGGYGSYGQDDAEVGEFVVTEANTHPNTTIVERLGTVEADSFQGTSRSPGARRGPSGAEGSHIAVNNLIHEAGRIGANGIVRLRVADCADGRYVASGEAVVLS
ncbi:hypothetical protein DFH28DRAFT_492163 [Melampsora americana]|nr:hypothetical protein DFH28DRAFT_492163 [Melampsora americana]